MGGWDGTCVREEASGQQAGLGRAGFRVEVRLASPGKREGICPQGGKEDEAPGPGFPVLGKGRWGSRDVSGQEGSGSEPQFTHLLSG